jgi:hypothetical protein
LLVSITGGAPLTQLPSALQVSTPLHTLPSEHEVPAATGMCVTPVAMEQKSEVHGLWSSTSAGVPFKHVPTALQIDTPEHTSPRPH